MPSIENAWALLKNANVVFLIASDEPIEKIISFKEKRNIILPFCGFAIKDSAGQMNKARPQTFIFNRKGELIYNRMGAFEWDDEKILKKLRSYIE